MTLSYPHIEIVNGSPFITSSGVPSSGVPSRVPVRRLWTWYQRGTSAETLIKRYPQLGPAKVLSALAFAFDNTALVEEDEMRSVAALDPDSAAVRLLPLRF